MFIIHLNNYIIYEVSSHFDNEKKIIIYKFKTHKTEE